MPANDDRNPGNQPFGDYVRDVLNRAAQVEDRKQHQAEVLDQVLDSIRVKILPAMEQNFRNDFNREAHRVPLPLEGTFLVTKLSLTGNGNQSMPPELNFPVARIRLSAFNVEFTELTADDIIALPAWKKLHEKARDMNIDIRLTGVTEADRRILPDTVLPGTLIFDATKEYGAGAAEYGALYPELPEKPAQPPRRRSGSHTFD